MNQIISSYPAYYRSQDGRGLLLPLLVGAAVGFPFGYIASNTNKNNQMPYYPYPVASPYMMPMGYPSMMPQQPYFFPYGT